MRGRRQSTTQMCRGRPTGANPETAAAAGTKTRIDEMCLDDWRRVRGLTWGAVAEMIGASSPRQARAWGLGIERPSEIQRERIAECTGGVVSVFAMHRVRLDWERANRRPLGHVTKVRRPVRRRVIASSP